jgi:hypothetical protein
MTAPVIPSSSLSSRNNNENKRRIQFIEGHETLLIEQLCELPVDDLWYTGDDYFSIKQQSRIDSKEWRKKGFDVLLRDTFQDPRPDAQEYINAFCQLEDESLSRRGLERHLSRKHGEERSDNKDRARYTVLSQQRKLRKQGMKQQDMAEQLAMLYQDVTRTAKIFARRVAKGDEVAVKKGGDDMAAKHILDEHDCSQSRHRMERRLSNFSVKSANSYNSNFSNPIIKQHKSSAASTSTRSWLSSAGRSSATSSTRRPSYNSKSSSSSGNVVNSTPTTPRSKCPSSPATPMEEYYAAIA